MERRGSQWSVPRLALISFYLGSWLINWCWGLSWKCPRLVEEGTEGLVLTCPRIHLLGLGQRLLGVFLSPQVPGAGFYRGVSHMMRLGWWEPAGAAWPSHTPSEPLSPLSTPILPHAPFSPHSSPLLPSGHQLPSQPHSPLITSPFLLTAPFSPHGLILLSFPSQLFSLSPHELQPPLVAPSLPFSLTAPFSLHNSSVSPHSSIFPSWPHSLLTTSLSPLTAPSPPSSLTELPGLGLHP